MIAIDSNFLVYFFEIGHRHRDEAKKMEDAQQLLLQLGRKTRIVVPVQVCGELFSVAVRYGRSRDVARAMVERIEADFDIVASDKVVLDGALELATAHMP